MKKPSIHSLGGLARAKIDPKKLSEIGRKGAEARWKKYGDNSKRILASKYKNATIKK